MTSVRNWNYLLSVAYLPPTTVYVCTEYTELTVFQGLTSKRINSFAASLEVSWEDFSTLLRTCWPSASGSTGNELHWGQLEPTQCHLPDLLPQRRSRCTSQSLALVRGEWSVHACPGCSRQDAVKRSVCPEPGPGLSPTSRRSHCTILVKLHLQSFPDTVVLIVHACLTSAGALW